MEEYIIVNEKGLLSPFRLQDEVNKKIKEGYVVTGGIGVVDAESTTHFYQAMIYKGVKKLVCPECNCDMEDIGHSYGCSNEDCATQIEKITK